MGLFTVLSSVELYPWSGFKIARAAGTSAFLVGKIKNQCLVKLASG